MSTSSVSSTTVNGVTRVTGLSSGIDVDSLVSQLMTAEKAKKLNPLEQKEQKAEWKQDAYQTIITDVQAFASKYFDTTSSTSLMSTKNFNQYTVTSSDSAVSASYTTAASAGSHSVTVSQLATAATLSSSGLSRDVTGGKAADYSDLSGKSIVLTVDDTDYTVDLSSVTDADSLQDAVDAAVGDGKLTVATDSSGYLTITATTTTDSDGTTTDSGVDEISISAPDSGTSGLSDLGFSASGAVTSNRLDTSEATLADIADYLGFTFNTSSDGDEYVQLTINGSSLTLDSDTTINELIDDVNDLDCGATLDYDDATGELVFTASQTGAGNLLAVSESGSTFLSTVMTASTAGTDAKMTVDGVAYTRSSNVVTVDGVTYTLNDTTDSGDNVTVSLTQDTDSVYDLISDFVTDYNSLIATINDELDEDYDTDYPPLTDDQKSSMTDDEITKWETKAKTGILEDDSTLKSFLSEIRSALVDSVSGLSTSIFDIGIDTGDYDENGKLEIDEDSLKEALASDPSAVMNLFTKASSSYPGTATVRTLSSSELSTRYKEEGIGYRFYDIIAEYTSTLKDSSGARGKLVEMAGLADSDIASDNSLSEQIDKYQEEISDEEDRLDDYEDKMYSKYTTLETLISNMNTQLTALQSYLNTSSS